MSYHLTFYTKNAAFSGEVLENYLTANLCTPTETNDQWVFDNEDTGVYFIIEKYDPADDLEDIDPAVFAGFKPTGFCLFLNLGRPDFFGLETFQFIDSFIIDLDLYVFNVQDEPPGPPYKPEKDQLYRQWSGINARVPEILKDIPFFYYPIERANLLWKYNFVLQQAQDKLGDNYFVPSALFVKTAHKSQVATLTTWTQHIPCVLPPVDYVVLLRSYKRFFRTIEEKGIVSYSKLMAAVGDYFEDYEVEGSRIIHPENAERIEKLFNSIEFDHPVEGFNEPIDFQEITNAKPSN